MKKLILAAVIAATTTFSGVAAHANSGWIAQGITLNARSGPGTKYHVLKKFHACTKVHIVGWKHGWAKVSYNHSHYWVSGKYVKNHSCHAYKPRKKVYYHNTHNTYKKHKKY